MRPRIFPTATIELEQIHTALQRATRKDRKLRLPDIRPGPTLYVLGLLLLGGVLLHPWQKSVDPLGDAKLSNAPQPVTKVTPVVRRTDLIHSDPKVPRAALVSLGTPSLQTAKLQWGDSFWALLPDGRWVVATAIGRAKSPEELPLTDNQIGDARWIGQHCFVWLNPIGQTNPTWIDP